MISTPQAENKSIHGNFQDQPIVICYYTDLFNLNHPNILYSDVGTNLKMFLDQKNQPKIV